MTVTRPYGIFAAFDGPDALREAARAMRQAGYRALDAHTAFPVDGLAQELGVSRSPIGWIIVAGIIAGAVIVYGLVWASVTLGYPINVGGRPLHAWPPFLLLAFEGGVLGGALAAFAGLLRLCRLPAYHHPAFDFAPLDFSEQRCFVLVVRADDPRYDGALLARLLHEQGATKVDEIAEEAP